MPGWLKTLISLPMSWHRLATIIWVSAPAFSARVAVSSACTSWTGRNEPSSRPMANRMPRNAKARPKPRPCTSQDAALCGWVSCDDRSSDTAHLHAPDADVQVELDRPATVATDVAGLVETR